MKASEFKQLIKEAVKEALKEELLEIVSPTVTSKEPQVGPPPPPVKQAAPFAGNNPLMEVLNMTSRTMSADDYRNLSLIHI